jgi:hypothetical protein
MTIMIQMMTRLYIEYIIMLLYFYLNRTEATWDARLGALGTSQFKSTSSPGAAGGLEIDRVTQPP